MIPDFHDPAVYLQGRGGPQGCPQRHEDERRLFGAESALRPQGPGNCFQIPQFSEHKVGLRTLNSGLRSGLQKLARLRVVARVLLIKAVDGEQSWVVDPV